MLWEFWLNRFQWGMVAKHSINPKNFYFASTQIAALPENVDGKNWLEAEQTLISKLYLCLGEKGQEEFHKCKPHLDLRASRYPRVLDAMEGEFKKERNETYEVGGSHSRWIPEQPGERTWSNSRPRGYEHLKVLVYDCATNR